MGPGRRRRHTERLCSADPPSMQRCSTTELRCSVVEVLLWDCQFKRSTQTTKERGCNGGRLRAAPPAILNYQKAVVATLAALGGDLSKRETAGHVALQHGFWHVASLSA